MARVERETRVVRAQPGGEVAIPAEFRTALGITADTPLRITLAAGELRIRPVDSGESEAGSAWLRELYELFAPVREEATAYSEAEIDQAIDEALAAVRRAHG